MKIEATILKAGGICCNQDSCPFKSDCANHRTAGDYRSESGFTPEIFEENGKVLCATIIPVPMAK